jgi:transposase-like protein
MHHFHFCPNPDCIYHQHAPTERWFVAAGFYMTKTFGKVPRFRCSACGKYFSSQTFSLDYFAKRTLPYPKIELLLSSSMSIRSLARFFAASCATIQNRIDRLARQALALHKTLRSHANLHEAVCIDGFVSLLFLFYQLAKACRIALYSI